MNRLPWGLAVLAVAAALLCCRMWVDACRREAVLQQQVAGLQAERLASERALAVLLAENTRIQREADYREQQLRELAGDSDLPLPELLRRLDGLLDALPGAGATSRGTDGKLPAAGGESQGSAGAGQW